MNVVLIDFVQYAYDDKCARSVMEERKDQCVVMATGYGKSLCYQFQAVFQDKLCKSGVRISNNT